MKVMLEEIERKKTEAEQARMEEERRMQERLRAATCYSGTGRNEDHIGDAEHSGAPGTRRTRP